MRALRALGIGLAFVAGVYACTPRADDVAFTEKTCGTQSTPREASPAVPKRTSGIAANAARLADGSVRVLVSPVVDVNATAAAAATSAAAQGDLALSVDATAVASFSVEAPKVDLPAATDILFVIDTTSSMFWAAKGVRTGVSAFVDIVAASGLDARVGGIEFGDEIRSNTPLGNAEDLKTWLGKIGVTGGGDGPENPIDSALSAWNTMAWRPGAQRVVIFITDTGFHEQSDNTKCADNNLIALHDALAGRAYVGVVHASLGGETPGVDPRRLADSVGGVYLKIDGAKVTLSFDVSTDTPFDESLASTRVVTIPASDVPKDAKAITLTYKGDAANAVTIPIDDGSALPGTDAGAPDADVDAGPADAAADG